MFTKRKTPYLALAIPLLAGTVLSPAVVSADSRSEGFAIHDTYAWQEYRKTFESDTAQKSRSTALPNNPTRQDVQKYVKDALNSNEGIDKDIKISGKMTKEDGSYRVAITYRGPNNDEKNLVVEMGKDGAVYDANTAMSDQELQRAYDEIVYGGKNEMSVFDIISVNDVLHSKTTEFFQNASTHLGVDADTASKAAAEGMALAGVVIMGAGVSPKHRKDVFTVAASAAHTNRVRASGDMTGKLSGQTGNADYDKWIAEAAHNENVPANLLYCLLNQESGFNPSAVSSQGAIGIAQFMPDTAASRGVDPYDPESSIKGAANYLRENYDKFGSWELALAAYNAGEGAVSKYGGIPPFPETQAYVSNIMSAYKAMEASAAKKDSTIARADSGQYNDCSDYGVGSLTQPTQNFLNTITTNFYNKTGVKLNVTSTLRPNDTNSWHSDGIAFDVANDEFLNGANGYTGQQLRDLYGSMAKEMGGTPLDEYPGGEGEKYARGWNYHISVHNQEQWQ